MASPSPQRLGQESAYLFLVACLPCSLVSFLFLFACLPCLLKCLATVSDIAFIVGNDEKSRAEEAPRYRDGFFSTHSTSMPSPQRHELHVHPAFYISLVLPSVTRKAVAAHAVTTKARAPCASSILYNISTAVTRKAVAARATVRRGSWCRYAWLARLLRGPSCMRSFLVCWCGENSVLGERPHVHLVQLCDEALPHP